ncbi:VOC family protein [Actinoplanes sp. NPDC051513]|uniref:VOC family protein n=1 Tax=Actinoplanes sp. NPDC051513 TaxID=3363908 RepID=UPI0037B559E4
MLVRWVTGFLDSPSADVEAFWLAVTGTTLSARRDAGVFATLLPAEGDACLRVQVVGDGPARAHLDLHVDDVSAAADEAGALGASVVRDYGDLVVLLSPAGIPFCVVPWHGERVRPRAVRWPGGQSSLVDQLALDIPADAYDAEVALWAALTGWAHRRSDLPEFRFLQGDSALPLRLLLQRIGDGAVGVHLDFAGDGVDGEVGRHVGLGAVVVRRVPGQWTTLRDPAGREYCVTGRTP